MSKKASLTKLNKNLTYPTKFSNKEKISDFNSFKKSNNDFVRQGEGKKEKMDNNRFYLNYY